MYSSEGGFYVFLQLYFLFGYFTFVSFSLLGSSKLLLMVVLLLFESETSFSSSLVWLVHESVPLISEFIHPIPVPLSSWLIRCFETDDFLEILVYESSRFSTSLPKLWQRIGIFFLGFLFLDFTPGSLVSLLFILWLLELWLCTAWLPSTKVSFC